MEPICKIERIHQSGHARTKLQGIRPFQKNEQSANGNQEDQIETHPSQLGSTPPGLIILLLQNPVPALLKLLSQPLSR
jgi:hypothetical protein